MRWRDSGAAFPGVLTAQRNRRRRSAGCHKNPSSVAPDPTPELQDWIFQSGKRLEQPWANPSKAVRSAFEEADLYAPQRLLHAIRHTVGTRLVRVTDIETARAKLGHRSIVTTMRYVHSDDALGQAAQAIGLLRAK